MFAQSYNQKYGEQIVKQHVMRNVVITELGKTYIVDNHYKKHLKLNSIDIEAHKHRVNSVFGQKLYEHMQNV